MLYWERSDSREISMVDDDKYRSDEIGTTDEWCETFRFDVTMSMNKSTIMINEQNNIPSRTVTTETTCREQEAGDQTDNKSKIVTDESHHLQSTLHC